MRLATRMKITYGMVFIIPILLMVVTFWGMGRIELKTLRQKYDMENAGMEVLVTATERASATLSAYPLPNR